MNSIRFDASRWRAASSALSRTLTERLAADRLDLRAALESTAAAVADKLMGRTFPSASAIGLAVAAMRFDCARVYATPGRVFEILAATAGPDCASAFYSAWKRGDISTARRVLRSSSSPIAQIKIGAALDPSLRETVRNRKTGRVMSAYPLQIVTAEELKAFARTACLAI